MLVLNVTGSAANNAGPIRIASGSGHAVTGSAHCLNQTVETFGFERFAQAADVYVDCTLLDKNVVSPHLVKQLGARVDPFRVCKQKVKQPELRRTQVEAFATSGNSVTRRVEA